MRAIRNTLGYTLTEALVVGVLIAILSAVAIPRYADYLKNTRRESVDQLAQSAAAAANDYYRKTGTDPREASRDLHLYYDPGRYAISLSGPNVTVTMRSHAEFSQTLSFR